MYVRCKKGLGGEEKGDRTSFLSRENRTIRDETHTHTHTKTKTQMGLVVARDIVSLWNSLLLNA